jgi:type II secretion system protein C
MALPDWGEARVSVLHAGPELLAKLRRDPRAPQFVSVLLGVAIAVQGVALVRDLLPERAHAASTPSHPRIARMADTARIITQAHLFGAPPAVANTNGDSPELQLTLTGTIATDDPAQGQAIIRMGKDKAGLFGANQQIDASTRLLQVFRDHAVILWRAAQQILWMPHSGAALALLSPAPRNLVAEQREAAPQPLDRHAVEPVLHTANYNSIADNADFLPINARGKSGVRVMGVKDEDKMAKVGLRDGDLIVSVDGAPVGSSAQLQNLLAALSHGQSVEAVIQRGGETVSATLQGQD